MRYRVLIVPWLVVGLSEQVADLGAESPLLLGIARGDAAPCR
jgi:hypothetical protein